MFDREGAAPAADPARFPSGTKAESPIDFDHLTRQCQGDPALEAEVLALFRREAEALFARLSAARDPVEIAVAAHKLRGGSLGVGAGRVAQAAALVEARASAGASTSEAVPALGAAVAEALAALAATRSAP